MKKLACTFVWLVAFLPVLSLIAHKNANPEERQKIAAEMEHHLQTELLNKWYPQCVDSQYGGFISTYTFDFKPTGPQDKFIVTQARHTWVNAKAAQRYSNVAHYKKSAQWGFRFLQNTMWDREYGGFYSLVDRQGKVKGEGGKDAYGNAFGLYALAAYVMATGDTGALQLAKKAFLWLEKHSHDPVHKGYFQHLERNGTPRKRTASTPSTSDLGYKDQNSSIHLLEAFTELYQVWPDPLVRERLQEMLFLVRDTITTSKGYLTLFLQPDWTPVTFKDSTEAAIRRHLSLDHVSFGHDVETAYLMLEASHVLGLSNDTRTMTVAKRMVDHALQNGWDNKTGGFYDAGYYFTGSPDIRIIKDSKNWWSQAEGLNTLLLMADLYPQDPLQYFEKFKKLWQYSDRYLIDHTYGDWYEGGLDKEPQRQKGLKGHIWKGTYHHYRSLTNCIQRLRTDTAKAAH